MTSLLLPHHPPQHQGFIQGLCVLTCAEIGLPTINAKIAASASRGHSSTIDSTTRLQDCKIARSPSTTPLKAYISAYGATRGDFDVAPGPSPQTWPESTPHLPHRETTPEALPLAWPLLRRMGKDEILGAQEPPKFPVLLLMQRQGEAC
jgi:hypothetical protein